MAESNQEKIRNMSEKAKAEIYNMQSRAMPPMPSFVRTQGYSSSASEPIGHNVGGERSTANRGETERSCEQNEVAEPPKKGLFGLDILKIIDAKGFKLDSDRILLLLLILLLSGEGGDEILVFALCYLML